MEVRRARFSDLDALVEFASEEAREAENRAQAPFTLSEGIRRALQDEVLAMHWVLVDEDDSPLGGISVFREWSDWNAGYYWWIQSMYLKPSYRGQGLMTLLLDAVAEEMRQQRGLELRLYVHNHNDRAIKAYRKAGFVTSVYEIMTRPG